MTGNKNIELERLDKLAKTYPNLKSLSNIAQLIGRAKQHFYTYKNRSGIGDEIMNELKVKLNINPKYILYGEQPIFLNQEKKSLIREPIAYYQSEIPGTQYDVFQKSNVEAIGPAYSGSLHEIIKKINLEYIHVADMKLIKAAMIDKIKEMNKYIKASNGD